MNGEQMPDWWQQDAGMTAYFNSLPETVQNFLIQSDVVVDTPGELMLVGEHLKNTLM